MHLMWVLHHADAKCQYKKAHNNIRKSFGWFCAIQQLTNMWLGNYCVIKYAHSSISKNFWSPWCETVSESGTDTSCLSTPCLSLCFAGSYATHSHCLVPERSVWEAFYITLGDSWVCRTTVRSIEQVVKVHLHRVTESQCSAISTHGVIQTHFRVT